MWSDLTGGAVGPAGVPGSSAPAVANGVVYFGVAGPGVSPRLIALDALTGSTLWSWFAGSASPPLAVVANGAVYVVSDQDLLLALRVDDADGDHVWDSEDNCPQVANAGQADADGDGVGDACDNAPRNFNPHQEDTDKDGVGDVLDNCRLVENPGQEDYDRDAVGDACDDAKHNYDPGQQDSDRDGRPDVLDPDDDNDGVLDNADNCPYVANPGQEDANGDGVGDACSYGLSIQADLRDAFRVRDEHFERYQLDVLACRECAPPGSSFQGRDHRRFGASGRAGAVRLARRADRHRDERRATPVRGRLRRVGHRTRLPARRPPLAQVRTGPAVPVHRPPRHPGPQLAVGVVRPDRRRSKNDEYRTRTHPR